MFTMPSVTSSLLEESQPTGYTGALWYGQGCIPHSLTGLSAKARNHRIQLEMLSLYNVAEIGL